MNHITPPPIASPPPPPAAGPTIRTAPACPVAPPLHPNDTPTPVRIVSIDIPLSQIFELTFKFLFCAGLIGFILFILDMIAFAIGLYALTPSLLP